MLAAAVPVELMIDPATHQPCAQRRNPVIERKKDASWRLLSPGGVVPSKAGDRIRTGDVQLGKLAFYR
jgi:hypothetical protein